MITTITTITLYDVRDAALARDGVYHTVVVKAFSTFLSPSAPVSPEPRSEASTRSQGPRTTLRSLESLIFGEKHANILDLVHAAFKTLKL